MAGIYFDFYGEINNGAHRKAANLIGAPAFVWHQALWNPAESELFEDREKRKIKVQSFLDGLRDSLNRKANEEPSNVSDVDILNDIEVLHDDRARVITFQFVWNKLFCKIRIENHTDYLSISSIIDASKICFGEGLESPDKEEDFHSKVLFYLNDFCSASYREKNAPRSKFGELYDTHHFIYKGIWEDIGGFFDDILNSTNHLQITESNGKKASGILGPRFADFRGLITCESYPTVLLENPSIEEPESRNIDELNLQYQPIQKPFYKAPKSEDERGQWHRNGRPSEEWARRRLDNVWDFLKLSLGKTSSREKPSELLGRTEFTVSRFMNGRMLYVSALGPQPKMGQEPGLEQPVLFYIHSITQCERQIGRLVDRLFNLGTLRLAAIIALPSLKEVPSNIEKINKLIRETRNEIHDLIQNAKDWDELKRNNSERSILGLLDLIQKNITALSASGQEIGKASIEYRLLRSRYYKELFSNSIGELRVNRIEGYQPYDEFVQRRLKSAFAFIDGIEIRINELRAEWRALDRLYLTTAVTILNQEIDDAQKNANRIHKKTHNIQLWGELWLSLALVPYYLSGICADLLNNTKYAGFVRRIDAVFVVFGIYFGLRAYSKILWSQPSEGVPEADDKAD